VTHLKAKIQQAKNIPADSLKIVYKGKTINNEDTIEKIGIKETDFLVVMSQIQVDIVLNRSRSQNLRKMLKYKLP